MKKKTFVTAFLLTFVAFQVNAQKKYSNPVYGADFPDPTVQRAPDGTSSHGPTCQASYPDLRGTTASIPTVPATTIVSGLLTSITLMASTSATMPVPFGATAREPV